MAMRVTFGSQRWGTVVVLAAVCLYFHVVAGGAVVHDGDGDA